MHETALVRHPVTFGQLSLLRSIRNMNPLVGNLPQVWELPAGTTMQQIETALITLEGHHEGLRTLIKDGYGDYPTQTVLAPRSAVEIQDAAEQDPQEAADRLGRMEFDIAEDYPWRADVVHANGQPRWLAICLHHVATDGWSVIQLQREFLALISGQELLYEAPTSRELAQEQWAPKNQSRRSSAQRHWQKVFRNAPPMARDHLGEKINGRWGRRGSTATSNAAAELAKTCQISIPSVLLAAYARAAAEQDQLERIMIAVFTSNRSDPRWEQLITTQDQLIPLVLENDASSSFESFSKKVHWELFTSYRHGEHNVDDLLSIANENGFSGSVNGHFEGSVSGLFSYFFNYMGQYQKDRASAPKDTEFGRSGRNIGAPLYLQVQAANQLICTLQDNSSAEDFQRISSILSRMDYLIQSAVA
jgi:hypothetical protein